MKTYELTYIISPDTTTEEAEGKAREIESSVQSKSGIILKQTNPAPRALSYPIKKYASGFLGVFEFQIEPENLSQVKDVIEKDGKVVRHMLIIKKAFKQKKERGSRKSPLLKPALETQNEQQTEEGEKPEQPEKKQAEKAKVELKDIEQKIDELLGE